MSSLVYVMEYINNLIVAYQITTTMDRTYQQIAKKNLSKPAEKPSEILGTSFTPFSKEDSVVAFEGGKTNSTDELKAKMTSSGSMRQKIFEERMEHFKERYKKNSEITAMENLAAERFECRFSPELKTRRSKEEFLKDQQNFVKEKVQKLKLLEQKESAKVDKELQNAPKINKKSQAIAERKRSKSKDKKDIYERLFKNSPDNSSNRLPEGKEVARMQPNRKTEYYTRRKLHKELEEQWPKGSAKLDSPSKLCILLLKH
eukprot:TRINITY_DN17206_c0_g1_i2.p1 TRINITY_DN17206_c0_g1~~TRINITY_DN17206_c0_g1_i2.p1  ORF type:complete len:287 (-),score=59.01 TRINITY_DN17206_c0_g1_i2:522-1298(-)